MKNINKIKKLIKKECACYSTELSSIHNYCCSEDGACLFFMESEKLPCCKYFEKTVLPLDTDLEVEYREEHKMDLTQTRKAKPKVKCERCGNSFDANSNRQKFCEKCRKANKREQAKLSMQKKRESKHNVSR